jgi:hypothetical protein
VGLKNNFPSKDYMAGEVQKWGVKVIWIKRGLRVEG